MWTSGKEKMSVYPSSEPMPDAVREAVYRLEQAGLACVLAWRPALGGPWQTAFANALLRDDEWEPQMVSAMAARVAAELSNRR